MDNTITALQGIYVALGGSLATVANMTYIPDVLNAIATQAATLALAAELPDNPSSNGTYILQAVKSNSGTVLSWAAKE